MREYLDNQEEYGYDTLNEVLTHKLQQFLLEFANDTLIWYSKEAEKKCREERKLANDKKYQTK